MFAAEWVNLSDDLIIVRSHMAWATGNSISNRMLYGMRSVHTHTHIHARAVYSTVQYTVSNSDEISAIGQECKWCHASDMAIAFCVCAFVMHLIIVLSSSLALSLSVGSARCIFILFDFISVRSVVT